MGLAPQLPPLTLRLPKALQALVVSGHYPKQFSPPAAIPLHPDILF